MGKSWLMCVLLGALAWGQAAPGAAPTQPIPAPTMPPAPPDNSASVPATAPVITVNGICAPKPKPAAATGAAGAKTPAKPAAAAPCKTVITKAQFEKMANNLAPNITPQMKKQLASVLPRLMAMSDEAKKEGLDKSPQYEERVKFNRMQILAQELQQKIQQDAAKISDADLQKYYEQHPEGFEQYSVDRLFIPRTKQENEAKATKDTDEKLSEEEQKTKQEAEKAKEEENEKAMTTLADDLRKRAAAGEEFIKLQKEAYDAAGMKIEAPTVNMANIRRTGLPPAQAAVFDLKPGEVSQVITDAGGHYVYKMDSKTEVPLEQAKAEIRSKLQSDRMRETMEKVNASFKVDLNEEYFGAGGPMPPRPARPRPGMPATAPSGQPQNPPPAQPPAAKPD